MARTPKPKPDPFEEIAAALPCFVNEDEAQTLVQQAAEDPSPGLPMTLNGEEVDPGAWRHLADPVTRLPPGCPVTPLGIDEMTAWFLSSVGGVVSLDAKSSGKGPIGYLFAGRSHWLEWAFPRFGAIDKLTKRPKVNGWDADDARQTLVDACAFKGPFELQDRVRGRGAWRDDDGELIYHAGDAVWVEGKWRKPGEIGRFIYPARAAIGRPDKAFEPVGPDSTGAQILDLLKTWHWDRPDLDPRLMLGWLMCALIGGALDQRPVVYVVGQEGTGKTTLQSLLRELMNGALVATSNTTQAGVYQAVKQDSVAIMVDEMEAKENSANTDKLLELARVAYSGDKMNRGGQDHHGKQFTLRSSFMASSIAMPPIEPQDMSRMAVLMLRPRVQVESGDATAAEIDELTIAQWVKATGSDVLFELKDIQAAGRTLLRRLFEWWPRWAALRRVFRNSLKLAGHSDRSADTFGALAAASHAAISDHYPTPGELQQWQGWLKADELEETAGQEPTWQRCFNFILTAQPEVFRDATCKSVGDLVLLLRKDEMAIETLLKKLPLVGMQVTWEKGAAETYDNARLFIAGNHVGAYNLFAGTNWKGRAGAPGPWLGVLRQAPDEVVVDKITCDKGFPKKFRGVAIRLAAALDWDPHNKG